MLSTARLLGTRRFGAFFITQLTGAYNDNVFRNALVLLVTFRITQLGGLGSGELVAASAGIFLLPFLLFSATGGTLADRFPRDLLIRRIKLFELSLMSLTWLGFVLESYGLLFTILFLTGLQSALFGPVKYAILPNLLSRQELLSGNAWVAAGTFVVILAGSVTGTLMMTVEHAVHWLPGILVLSSGLGYLASRSIPPQAPGDIHAPLTPNFLRATYAILRDGLQQRELVVLMLAIGWFWMIGIAVLTQLPLMARDTLGGNERALTGVLATFTIGVGLGALLCTFLLRGRARATWAPLTALFMGVTFWMLSQVAHSTAPLRSFDVILADAHTAGIMWTLFALAVAGGFYIVPLYTLLQQRTENQTRARIIACNNILSSGFMVLASLLAMMTFHWGGTIQTLWLILAISTVFPIVILFRFTGASWRRVLLWPRARVHLESPKSPLPDQSLVFTRHADEWTAWGLSAAIAGRLEIYAPEDLLKKPSMRLLAKWVTMKPLELDNANWCNRTTSRITVVLPPPAHECTLPHLMRMACRHSTRPLAVASVVNLHCHLPRFYPHLRIALEASPSPARGDMNEAIASQNASALYSRLGELEFRLRDRACSTLQDLHQAARRFGPNRPILSDPERTLTYRKLLQGTYAVAGLLKRTLPKQQDTVGVLLPTVAATPIVFFAIQALRRIPVMLNFTAGASNIASACRTAGLTHIITSRKFIERAELQSVADALAENYTLIWLDDLTPNLKLHHKLAAAGRALGSAPADDPENPAVVLFTSGSEGEPKGVVLSHRNLQSNRNQVCAVLDVSPRDRILLCLPLYHSFALGVGLLLPLDAGIPCHLYPNPTHYKQIPEMLREKGTTIFFSTDTFLNGYAKYTQPEDLHSVRLLVAGAEPLKQRTRKHWNEKFGIDILEGYGVTETSPAISVNTSQCNRPGSVGRLLPSIEARLQPLEDADTSSEGTQGRLEVRGPNVMSGYWLPGGNRALTPPPDGWHDTGDVGNFDQEGFLSLQGRAKRFAKIGGEMVSLAFVEQQVSDVWTEHRHVVCAVSHPTRGQQLVLLTEHPQPDLNELRQMLSSRGVTELAHPRRMVPVETLPILGSGKPDLREAQKLAESVLH